ncbi:MAG: TetR/AcrR family transcriptional regulator [Bacteroidales bacterium]
MTPKKIEKDTELKILEAAKRIFVLKGLDGARMQEIADEAGINKALLHYYFRSKDQLFMMVFKVEVGKFFPSLLPILKSKELNNEEKIRQIVELYINLFLSNPFLPVFIIREINRNPQDIVMYFKEAAVNIDIIRQEMVEFALDFGYKPDEAMHLIVNIVSMCIFPFAGRPIIENILFNSNSSEFSQFLNNRKQYVADFIINSLRGKLLSNKE